MHCRRKVHQNHWDVLRHNEIAAHLTGVLLLCFDFSVFFLLSRENSTPAGRIKFTKQRNTCPYKFKLGYASALFCFCIFHTCLLSLLNHIFLMIISPPPAWMLHFFFPWERQKSVAGCDRRKLGHVWKPTSDLWVWVSISGHVWVAALAWCPGKSQPRVDALIFF